MTRKLFTAAWILFALWLVSFALSSFALDPENIGGRLALYLPGILAFITAVVLLIIALVKRAGERRVSAPSSATSSPPAP